MSALTGFEAIGLGREACIGKRGPISVHPLLAAAASNLNNLDLETSFKITCLEIYEQPDIFEEIKTQYAFYC